MIETHVDRARGAVERERSVLEEERAAYEQFRRRVASVSTTGVQQASGGTAGAVAVRAGRSEAGTGACERVREAFAETVRPHSVADVGGDESLLETIREELGDSIALALAPTTDAGFTAETKRAVLTAARERERGIDATVESLDSEADSLREVGEAVDEITDWVADADETPLSELGFEELRERHARLGEYRERCSELLEERQALLRSTTGRNQSADVPHLALVRYLYEPLPVVFPVLSTLTRLYDLLGECQRAVRAYLTRCG